MSMQYGPYDLAVPSGFQNILHLISQEVLRVSPSKPLDFIANFLDDLLAIREQCGYDPVAKGDMIERVQEHYWKFQREKNKADSEHIVTETDSCKLETSDGAGDVGPQVVSPAQDVIEIVPQEQADSQQDQGASQPHPSSVMEQSDVNCLASVTGGQGEEYAEEAIDSVGGNDGCPEGEETGVTAVSMETQEHSETQVEDEAE